MVQFQNLKNRLVAQDLLYQFMAAWMLLAFWEPKGYRSSQTCKEGEFLHSLVHGTSYPVSINGTVGNLKVK